MLELLVIIMGVIVGIYLYIIYANKKQIQHGPDSSIMRNIVIKDNNGKCYMFEPKVYICPVF